MHPLILVWRLRRRRLRDLVRSSLRDLRLRLWIRLRSWWRCRLLLRRDLRAIVLRRSG